MIPIDPPNTQEDDDLLQRVCSARGWMSHYAQWQAYYDTYRTQGGNPWILSSKSFVPDISSEQKGLYDSQNQSPRLQALRHQKVSCCPMCGSPNTGTLDHYLPREVFPEFSVFGANLIPACSLCNSGKKRRIYRGANANERFLHPYFDQLVQSAVWQVRIWPNYTSATFTAEPLPGLSPPDRDRVSFHLQNVLGLQFYRFAERRWSTLPRLVRNSVPGARPITALDVQNKLKSLLEDSLVSTGENSWETAFWRGLGADLAAQAYIVLVTP